MTCNCCASGRCCNGENCTQNTKSQCATLGGEHTAGGSCVNKPCVNSSPNSPYSSPCEITNACKCASQSKTLVDITPATCNCNTLADAGVPFGGCQRYYCEECSDGSCVPACPAPRECCAGVCCPLSQTCGNNGQNCVNKCTNGRFCAGNGTAFNCCGPTETCCGASGCLPNTGGMADFSVNVANNSWVSTGLTIPAGTTLNFNLNLSRVKYNLPSNDETDAGGIGGSSGDPCNVTPTANHMALIGRVGGTIFVIGAANQVNMPAPGLLELRQNDNCVQGNSGFFDGTVFYGDQSGPCPGFTPAAIGEPIVYSGGETPPSGPGAALKSLLRIGGIVSSPTCSCNARAAKMDVWGEWECLKRLPEICGWLKEEADKREMWFCRPVGYALVLAAVFLSALKRQFRGNNK